MAEFLASEDFRALRADERINLVKQFKAMKEYSNILADRISSFNL